MVRALETERKKMLQYRLQYYMELLLQAVNGETEVKIKPLSASCSHQAVKRGGGSESSPPSRLDRSHGGCYESTAQVCAPASPNKSCFETSEALHMQQRVWYRAAAALVRAYAILVPALVVTVRHQKCKVQLSD